MSYVLVHIGLGVTDIERSRRFYEGAFDFVYDRELKLPAATIQPLMALDPPSDIHAAYLMLRGFTLELLTFDPASRPDAANRLFNQTGLTHLSIAVDDIPGTLAKIRDLGGTVLNDIPRAAIVRDPDGQLIELVTMEMHDQVERGRAERGGAGK
ncbi:VOC family protein [Sphingomonas bacterium]|uniref:VOC family protein n=1 Tax=Sphingomonas bacterium TaxID=1895847 RepID=UPI001576DF0B|nr:VOC family protein [Sphingomonas bacterium]